METINALGRRKAAVARVYLSDGKGKITVNGRDYKEYFGAETLQYVVTQPLVLLNAADKYDINCNLDGGGVKGQAEALRLGITIQERLKGKNRASQKPARDSSSVNVRNYSTGCYRCKFSI
jgi:ribosomal protein S9